MGTTGAIVVGGLAVAFFAVGALKRRLGKRLARKLYERHRDLWLRKSAWRVVEGEDLEPWREPVASAIVAELQRLGFTRIGYIEHGGHTAQEEQRLVTAFINSSGDVHTASREVNGLELLEFETEFTDGHVLRTDNFPEVLAADSSPEALEVLHRPGAAASALLQEHLERVARRLASTSGAAARSMRSTADVVASQDRQHEITRAFRERLGFISDEEWERIADGAGLSGSARRTVLAEYRALAASDRQGRSR